MAQAHTPPAGERWLGSFGPGEQILGAQAHERYANPETVPGGLSVPGPRQIPPAGSPPSWDAERRRGGERGPLEAVRWWDRRAG